MSRSRVQPSALSSTFAVNRGTDEVIVRRGQLSIDPQHYPAGGYPNAWGEPIPFDIPYVYTGGDLLVELASTGLGMNNGRLIDTIFPSPGTNTWAGYGAGFNATTANFGIVNDLMFAEYRYYRPEDWRCVP